MVVSIAWRTLPRRQYGFRVLPICSLPAPWLSLNIVAPGASQPFQFAVRCGISGAIRAAAGWYTYLCGVGAIFSCRRLRSRPTSTLTLPFIARE